MMVIYHDFGGTHSSCVAANIHINILQCDVVPDKVKLHCLPTFDKIQSTDMGCLKYIGEDEFGAKVYTLYRRRAAKFVIPAIRDMYNLLMGTKNNEGLYLVDTAPAVNSLMAIGGFTSRRLGIICIGRPIVTYGTIRNYKTIANIVERVKKQMREDMGKFKP